MLGCCSVWGASERTSEASFGLKKAARGTLQRMLILETRTGPDASGPGRGFDSAVSTQGTGSSVGRVRELCTRDGRTPPLFLDARPQARRLAARRRAASESDDPQVPACAGFSFNRGCPNQEEVRRGNRSLRPAVVSGVIRRGKAGMLPAGTNRAGGRFNPARRAHEPLAAHYTFRRSEMRKLFAACMAAGLLAAVAGVASATNTTIIFNGSDIVAPCTIAPPTVGTPVVGDGYINSTRRA